MLWGRCLPTPRKSSAPASDPRHAVRATRAPGRRPRARGLGVGPGKRLRVRRRPDHPPEPRRAQPGVRGTDLDDTVLAGRIAVPPGDPAALRGGVGARWGTAA